MYENEGPMKPMGHDFTVRAPATTPLNIYSDDIDRLAQAVEELQLRLEAILRPPGPENPDPKDSNTYNRLTALNENFTHQLDRLQRVIERIDL